MKAIINKISNIDPDAEIRKVYHEITPIIPYNRPLARINDLIISLMARRQMINDEATAQKEKHAIY